jgi:hypothetical protein
MDQPRTSEEKALYCQCKKHDKQWERLRKDLLKKIATRAEELRKDKTFMESMEKELCQTTTITKGSEKKEKLSMEQKKKAV